MSYRNDNDIFSPNMYDNIYYEAAIVAKRAPTVSDKYEIGKLWIDTTNDDVYFMTNVTAGSAVWINAGGGTGVFAALQATTGNITADAGNFVATLGNLNIVAGTITVGALTAGVVQTSAAGLFSSTTGTDGQILIDATAGVPAWATITAGAGINVTNAANGITITATGAVASTFPCDGGVATPAAGATTMAGGTNITTAGAGSTVTINLDGSPSVAGSLTAGVDLTMTSGDCTIIGTTDGAQTIYLHANGGITETIDIHADQGTAVDSILVQSDDGGLTLAAGLASADAINVSALNGGVDIDGALTIQISSSKNATDAIVIESTAGGIDVTATGGAGEDIDITATSSVNIGSTEDDLDAIYLHANGGTGEGIHIHSDQGTGVASINIESDVGGITATSGLASNDAINLNATAGGLDIDAALQINVTSSQAAADAIVIDASNAAGGIDCDYGTGGYSIVGGNGAFALETGTGTIDLGVDLVQHVITIGNVTGNTEVAINTGTAGFNVATTGAGDITLDSDDTVLIDADGVLEINSSGGIIGIGNDADAQNINIGIGAAERIITIGNVTTATQVVLDCGTAGVSLGASATDHTSTFGGVTGTSATTLQAGTGAMTLTAGGAVDVNATGAVTVDSSGGTIGIAVNDIDQNVNISTDGERVTTIGSNNGAAGVVVDCGTGNASFGATATAHTTTLGSTNTTSITTVQAGTGAMTFTAGGIFDVNATGNVTIDSSGGTIGIGVNDIDQHINIGIDGERTTTIGSNNGAAGVVVDCGTGNASFGATATAHTTTLGSINTTSITTVQAGTGAMTFTAGGVFDVNATGAATIDSTGGAISIGSGANAQAVNICTGAAARALTLGSSTAGASTTIVGGNTGDILLTQAAVSGAGVALTLNAKIGRSTHTGVTTASAAQETFTITNSEVSATSGMIVTVTNIGTNDARMTLERVKQATGSFTVDTQNNGAAQLNGNVVISWIVFS